MTTLIAWAFAALLVTLFIWCLSRMSPPTKDIEGKILAYGGTMRPMPRKAHEKLFKGYDSFDSQIDIRKEFEAMSEADYQALRLRLDRFTEEHLENENYDGDEYRDYEMQITE